MPNAKRVLGRGLADLLPVGGDGADSAAKLGPGHAGGAGHRRRRHRSMPAPAACMIVKVGPRTPIVPMRAGLPAGFSATLKLTVPFPAPPGGPVIVIHESVEEADQGQVSTVVTEKLPVPAPAAKFCDVGVSV